VSRRAHGLRAWLLQRFTAVYMAGFILFALARAWQAPLVTHAEWKDWVADPFVNLSIGLFVLALLLHAWVGIRDVIMDYVRHTGLRVSLLALVALTLAGSGLWLLRVLFVLAY